MPPSDNHPAALPADDEQQLRETMAFFERILQTMPDDRVSLEVLAQAYEQAGDAARAAELLVRLAGLAARDNDREAATALADRLAPYGDRADARAARAELSRLVAAQTTPAAVPAPRAEVPRADQALRRIHDPSERRAIVTQELDFAWMLHEQNLLSEDQYALIVSDLTDLSASQSPIPISTLHLYHDRQLPNIDRVLAFAADKGGIPLLPLTSFDPQAEAYTILPLDYLVVKGVLPFEVMAGDLLVALLNPVSDRLRQEVTALTGRRCHFYLAQPPDFDQTIERLRKVTAGATADTLPKKEAPRLVRT